MLDLFHSHAHRQVTLKGVQVITPEISRGRIQKSVCVLSSQVPSMPHSNPYRIDLTHSHTNNNNATR